MTRTIMHNLRQHIADVIAADGEAWQTVHGWNTRNHSITVTRRGTVVVRRFAGKSQEYDAGLSIGDLDALVCSFAPAVDFDEDAIPTPATARLLPLVCNLAAFVTPFVTLAAMLLAL